MEGKTSVINNDFYDDLGEGWYHDTAHPIALLRAENRARTPWIIQSIEQTLGSGQKVLDIGCGAGFLTNALADRGHHVTGVDLSHETLEIAKKHDKTASVSYVHADAATLPFLPASFDVVCAMDFLEHVDNPARIIAEASRVLKPGGLFFFHTFNRNWLSWLIVIKGVEWCVPNTPPNMHIYSLFLKPQEVTRFCAQSGIAVQEIQGLNPHVLSRAFWRSFFQRRVDDGLQFKFSPFLSVAYVGYGKKAIPLR